MKKENGNLRSPDIRPSISSPIQCYSSQLIRRNRLIEWWICGLRHLHRRHRLLPVCDKKKKQNQICYPAIAHNFKMSYLPQSRSMLSYPHALFYFLMDPLHPRDKVQQFPYYHLYLAIAVGYFHLLPY